MFDEREQGIENRDSVNQYVTCYLFMQMLELSLLFMNLDAGQELNVFLMTTWMFTRISYQNTFLMISKKTLFDFYRQSE